MFVFFSAFILLFRNFFFSLLIYSLYVEPIGAALTKVFLFFLYSQLLCDWRRNVTRRGRESDRCENEE